MRCGVLAISSISPACRQSDEASLHPFDEFGKWFPYEVAAQVDGGLHKPHANFLKVVTDKCRFPNPPPLWGVLTAERNKRKRRTPFGGAAPWEKM